MQTRSNSWQVTTSDETVSKRISDGVITLFLFTFAGIRNITAADVVDDCERRSRLRAIFCSSASFRRKHAIEERSVPSIVLAVLTPCSIDKDLVVRREKRIKSRRKNTNNRFSYFLLPSTFGRTNDRRREGEKFKDSLL